jgi:SAM-dependent methyltransferase
MKAAEFDKFAEEYLAQHAENIKLSGEDPEYFAKYKIDAVQALYARLKRPSPEAVMDFGCGIGASLPHLARAFPQAKVVGLDVSERSLAIASHRFPGVADLVLGAENEIPFPPETFDLIFSACVFHHIDHADHVALLAKLRARLRPGGALVLFEHNPYNPVTRYIVATCPFDENAVLIPAPQLKARQMAAGFSKVRVAYTGFFPAPLRALRPLEKLMTSVPLGAQYFTFAT